MKTIVAAIDFSDASRWVADCAAELASGLHGEAVLLHAGIVPSLITDSVAERERVREFAEGLEEVGESRLREYVPAFEDRMVPVSVVQVPGRAADVIVDQARRLPADYIVMGSRGHSALHDLVLGSTTSGVLRHATCPVIVVTPPGGEAHQWRRRAPESLFQSI